MDFRQLHYISTVAEHGSITKAAKALYISQPSLSHFIAKTEQELGGKLFDRSTNPLTLTYAGEQYMRTARQILMLSDDMSKEFRDISGHHKGRLRVGLPRERAAFMLPLILPAFKQEYPGIQVEVLEGSGSVLLEALSRGRTDFIILPYHVREKNLEFEPIYEEELLLAAAPGVLTQAHMLEGCPGAVDLSRLGELPFILLKQGHAVRESVDLLMKSARLRPTVALETTSNIGACRMAAVGIGLAIVPRMTLTLANCEPQPALYALSARPVTWVIPAIYRREAYIGVVEQAFFRIAREALAPYSVAGAT